MSKKEKNITFPLILGLIWLSVGLMWALGKDPNAILALLNGVVAGTYFEEALNALARKPDEAPSDS